MFSETKMIPLLVNFPGGCSYDPIIKRAQIYAPEVLEKKKLQ